MSDQTPIELAYAAGLLDGEGCILIKAHRSHPERPRTHALYVQIIMTELEPLEWMQERFGGSIYKRPKQQASHRQGWQWTVSTTKALPLLRAIQPYARVKRRQIEAALRFDALRTAPFTPVDPALWAQREALRLEISALNYTKPYKGKRAA